MKLSYYLLLLCKPLTACATGPFEWKYGPDKIVPGQFAIGGTQGTVVTWPSHAVGAVIYPGTKSACIQSAQSAKARNSSGNGGLTIKLPESVDVNANLGQIITEAVGLIQDKNDVATFADVALFQVCTNATNNNLSPAEAVMLIQTVLAASVGIARARPDANRSSPRVTPPVQPVGVTPNTTTTSNQVTETKAQ